jgi:hypothetical protein
MIRASGDGIRISNGGAVLGGIQVASHGVISAHSGIRVIGATAIGGITNGGIISAAKTAVNISV